MVKKYLTADFEMQTNVFCLRCESFAVLLTGATDFFHGITGSVPHVNTSNQAPYFIQS